MDRVRLVMMLTAIVAGLGMTAFYDWSGEDQSRSAPVVWWVAIAILVADLAAIVWIVGIREHHQEQRVTRGEDAEDELVEKPEGDQLSRHRFGIRHVLIVTTVAAVMASSSSVLTWHPARGVVIALLSYFAWIAFRQRKLRMPIICLVSCMWGPFLWLFNWRDIGTQRLELLIMLMDVPGLIAAMWASVILRLNLTADSAFGAIVCTVELAFGLYFIHTGSKRTLIYTLGALTMAIYSSFVLQALLRA